MTSTVYLIAFAGPYTAYRIAKIYYGVGQTGKIYPALRSLITISAVKEIIEKNKKYVISTIDPVLSEVKRMFEPELTANEERFVKLFLDSKYFRSHFSEENLKVEEEESEEETEKTIGRNEKMFNLKKVDSLDFISLTFAKECQIALSIHFSIILKKEYRGKNRATIYRLTGQHPNIRIVSVHKKKFVENVWRRVDDYNNIDNFDEFIKKFRVAMGNPDLLNSRIASLSIPLEILMKFKDPGGKKFIEEFDLETGITEFKINGRTIPKLPEFLNLLEIEELYRQIPKVKRRITVPTG